MKKVIILATALLTLLSLIAISKADFSSDIIKMLPLNDKVIAEQYKILKAFNSMNITLFEISSDDKTNDFEILSSATHEIISNLKKDSLFLFGETISATSFFELRNCMIANWPALFSKKDSIYISKRLNSDSLTSMLDRSLASLFTLGSSETDSYLLKADPFGFYPILLSKLSMLRPASNITFRDGYLTNTENSRILIFAKNGNISNEQTLINSIKQAEEIANKYHCKFIWMGSSRATMDNSRQIKHDINLTLPITIFLIFFICFAIYRNKSYGFLTFIPTISGIVITFGICSLFFDFSLITMGFGAALMGITVDFAIHFLYHKDRFIDEISTVQVVKMPIITSAFTTAGAFLVLAFTGIPALSQLGIITAIGIIITATLTLIFLPTITPKSKHKSAYTLNMSSFFLNYYNNISNKKTVVLFLTLAIPLFFMIPKLSFDGNPNNMNGMNPETIAAEKMLNDHWEGIGSGAYLAATSNSLDELLQFFEERVTPLTVNFKKNNIANSTGSFTELLPSKNRQIQNQIRWDALFTQEVIDTMRLVADVITKRYSLPTNIFYSYIDSVKIKSKTAKITINTYPKSFKNKMLNKSLIKSGNLWIGNTPIFATSDTLWNYIDSCAKDFGVIGVNDAVLGIRIVTLIKEAFLKSAILIPFIILIILAVTLKKLRSIFAVFLPTSIASGISLGVMALFKIEINIVTMMVFAFVFGLGIDYSLLIYYMSIKKDDIKKVYLSEGAASVTVAAATTISGLGILIFAGHPVISTLGSAGVIGILSSYFSAIILVPFLTENL